MLDSRVYYFYPPTPTPKAKGIQAAVKNNRKHFNPKGSLEKQNFKAFFNISKLEIFLCIKVIYLLKQKG